MPTFPVLNLQTMKLFVACTHVLLLFFSASAQNCSGYYYLTNSAVEMTTYDKKAKESGKLTYTITNANKTGNTTTASFASEMKDEKGKSISKGAGKYKCSGGILFRSEEHTSELQSQSNLVC